MDIKATLKPGQGGTEQMVEEYGAQLICVRYRYDKSRKKRIKTVELIIEEQDWVQEACIPEDMPVLVQVGFHETALREKVREAGARWDAEGRAWRLPYRKVMSLGLEGRVDEALKSAPA